jgi:hypothetical protein
MAGRKATPEAQATLARLDQKRATFRSDYEAELQMAKDALDAKFRNRQLEAEELVLRARYQGASITQICDAYHSKNRNTIYDIINRNKELNLAGDKLLDTVFSFEEFTVPDSISYDGHPIPGYSGYGLRANYAHWGADSITVDSFYYASEDARGEWTFSFVPTLDEVDGQRVLHDKSGSYYAEANSWAKAHREEYQPPKEDVGYDTGDKWADV